MAKAGKKAGPAAIKNLKCVCCGGPLPEEPWRVEEKVLAYGACSADCQAAALAYLRRDHQYKLVLYGFILAAAAGVIFTALSSRGAVITYGLQAAAGAAFICLPYPVSTYTTFHYSSIRSVVRFSRIAGVILAGAGIGFGLLSF